MAATMKELAALKAEKEWVLTAVFKAQNEQSLEWQQLSKNPLNQKAQSQIMALEIRRDELRASKEQAKGTARAHFIQDEIIAVNKQMKSTMKRFLPEARRFISLSESLGHQQNKIDVLSEDIRVLDKAITSNNPKIASNIRHDVGDLMLAKIVSNIVNNAQKNSKNGPMNLQSLLKSLLTEIKSPKKARRSDDDDQKSNPFCP